MQQDAIRRVREMQKRANASLQQSNREQAISDPPSRSPKESMPENHRDTSLAPVSSPQQPAPRQKNPSGGFSLSGILDQLGIQQDQILILILMFLLWGDERDNTLLLALFYLLF